MDWTLECIYVLGAVYLDKCPREKNIPIYILVFGVCVFVMGLVGNVRKYKDTLENRKESQCGSPFEIVLKVFLFAWSIAGMKMLYIVKQIFM